MGIMQSPQSAWSKEQALWETQPVRIGDSLIMPTPREQGGRFPYIFQEYPKAMFKAERAPTGGGVKISAHVRVNDETEERQHFALGWRAKQEDALEMAKQDELEIARLAANALYHEQRMSEKAREEANAVRETSARHLGEIPAKPIKRAYRKKAQAEAGS